MSSSVFPTLKGIAYPVKRTPQWNTAVQKTVSGKRTAIGLQSSPLSKWEMTYNYLRADNAFLEFQTLMAFFNSIQGQYDTFLYTDVDDNSVTAQALGSGDGTKTAFQLLRTQAGSYSYIEAILAPNVVSQVFVNGVLKTVGTDYTVSSWGSATPGVITFVTAPGAGLPVTATFTYYWPVAFTDDTLEFDNFLSKFYSVQTLAFQQVK